MKNIIILCLTSFLLTACGAGTTTIVDTYDGDRVNLATAFIEPSKPNANVPDDIQAKFKASMDKYFFEKGLFEKGTELKVKYTFIQFEAGNQAARYFTGGLGNAGEASLTVKVDFMDSAGKKLSTINVGGKIGSGFFGGSMSEALGKAAKEAAEYAAASFI